MSEVATQHMAIVGPSKAVCHCCGDIKKLSDFSPSDHGAGLSTVCDECRAKRKLSRKSQKIKDRKSRRLEEFARQISRRNLGLPRLGELAVGMIRQFGGIESFCAEWFRNIEAAEPGSKTRLDQYKAVGTLVKHANEQLTPTALDDLDDDELQEELFDHLREVGKLLEIQPASDDDEDEPEIDSEVDHGAA